MDVKFRKFAIYRSLYCGRGSNSAHPSLKYDLNQSKARATLDVIHHLGYVQIDTISVVERAHHHVLWNRVEDYQKDHLNLLLENQQIFEYWFHAASYIPMRDYRYALRQMNMVKRGESKYFNGGDQKLMREMLARAKSEGEIKSRDFVVTNKKSSHTWWNSGIVRKSIEQLYMQGDLMVRQRSGAEKVYALKEDSLNSNVDLIEPSLDEYALYLYETVKRSQGVFTWKQLIHLKTGIELKTAMQRIIDEQIDAKSIQLIRLSSGESIYVDLKGIEEVPNIERTVKILSPFDNLVIHRDRLMKLFDFDYRLECYVKPEQRQYGYFSLPILYGIDFVAKIDCKAHRAEGILEILNFHVQTEILNKADFFDLLVLELKRFAAFNDCHLEVNYYQKLKL